MSVLSRAPDVSRRFEWNVSRARSLAQGTGASFKFQPMISVILLKIGKHT